MLIRLKVAIAGAVLSTSIVSAQQAVRPRIGVKAARTASAPAREIRSLINGVVFDSNRKPLPNASIRLRNLAKSAIERVITANAAGEFTFVAQPGVPYVVEIADEAGRAVAVGDVVFANPGEVAGTVVSMPSHLPPLAGVFSETARTVTSAATNSGLAITDPNFPKLSPTK